MEEVWGMEATEINFRRDNNGKLREVSRYKTADGKIIDGGKVISLRTKNTLEIPTSPDNYTIELSQFATNVINKFNDEHRTRFQIYLVQHNGYTTRTNFDKQSCRISVSLGIYGYSGACTQERLDAVKLDIAHAMCHYMYANMSTNFIQSLATIADKVAGSYRKVIMNCCIETAADMNARTICRSMGIRISEDVYEEYRNLMLGDQIETDNTKVNFLKRGQLPPSERIKLLKVYKSFTENDWEPLSEIISSFSRLSKDLLGRRDGIRNYEKWIRAQLEMVNFPNRVNRAR